ncbi:MAG: 2,3-bisphosphoglycerate-independent phosphoglycerate mutase [Eubacteriales bacterium]|nr:2,3-bisphosphoglycerate-independent phosphoglycerate mutase [Eubacteriales bacterium]
MINKNKNFNRTVLCIMDGLGYSPREQGNAVVAAGMPNLTKARNQNLTTLIKASGHEVGLDSAKDAGNSEVGHNAMGAGVTIKQGLSLLNDAFATGKIFESAVWQKISTYPKLNIIILCSNGRVHSNIEHLFQVIKQCEKQNLPYSVIAITDGRDVSPRSAAEFLAQLPHLSVIGGRGQIFMDRYQAQTEMLTRAFEVCVEGKAPVVKDWRAYLEEFYQNNPSLSDEQVPPVIVDKDNLIKNGEAILLLNYRGDRAVETARMFDQGDYLSDAQRALVKDCYFAGILQYDAELNLPKNYLCEPPVISNTLTEWLCQHSARQYTVTETVKFGHMTYFFNGNKSAPIDPKLETWLEIPSDKLNNLYNKAPKMKAVEITDKLIENIESGNFDFLKCNLPNPDMVGHCGEFDAAVVACQTVDECVGRLYDVCQKNKVNLIVTADHGNAEEMTDENGKVKTSHTNNLVPIAICPFADPNFQMTNTEAGHFGLTNLAATICDLMGIPADPHFNPSMIKRA